MTHDIKGRERLILDMVAKTIDDFKSVLRRNGQLLDIAGASQSDQIAMMVISIEVLSKGSEERTPKTIIEPIRSMLEHAKRAHDEGERTKDAEIGELVEKLKEFVLKHFEEADGEITIETRH